MNKHLLSGIAATTFAASMALAAPASAATFDPVTGIGFVGKGEVQELTGWNNKTLQTNANAGVVDFEWRHVSSAVTTWTCDRDAGPQTQGRTNTITTTVSDAFTTEARDGKNQLTGFKLLGYDRTGNDEDVDGPAVGSCPTGWTAINLVTSDPVVLESGLFLLVNDVDSGKLTVTSAA